MMTLGGGAIGAVLGFYAYSTVKTDTSYRNSRNNTKSQHGYEIYEKGNQKVVKIAISGRPLN